MLNVGDVTNSKSICEGGVPQGAPFLHPAFNIFIDPLAVALNMTSRAVLTSIILHVSVRRAFLNCPSQLQ